MMLMDLLEVIDENKNVDIKLYDEVVTYYDGKNSIDDFYNDFRVLEVTTDSDKIVIEIMG